RPGGAHRNAPPPRLGWGTCPPPPAGGVVTPAPSCRLSDWGGGAFSALLAPPVGLDPFRLCISTGAWWGRHSCLPCAQGRQECLPHQFGRTVLATSRSCLGLVTGQRGMSIPFFFACSRRAPRTASSNARSAAPGLFFRSASM